MKDFEKGAKRKCPACSTLFFDFNNSPIICPNCGTEVTSLLTNVSKRGRPPKNSKPDAALPENTVQPNPNVDEMSVEDDEIANIEGDTEITDIENDEPVEEIVEVPKEEEWISSLK